MAKGLLDTLNDISLSLATLALQVRAESRAGYGSRNKIAEHILMPVLRRVYSAPGLINTNKFTANFPGVDLFDYSTGLGVQITSSKRSAKIAKTIDTIVAGTLPLTHLVIAVIAEDVPRRNKETCEKWVAGTRGQFAFDPVADVVAFDDLFSLIEDLPPDDITDIANELRSLVLGSHQFHLLPHLQRSVRAQLEEEQRIARYIPDVFVETQETKYQARCFTHPVLFIQRISDWFNRQPFVELNRLATMSGVPSVKTPDASAITDFDTLQGAVSKAEAFKEDLDATEATLELYSKFCKDGDEAILGDPARAHVLVNTRWDIGMIADSLPYRLGNRRTELNCVTDRILLITGPAGQGKTNFLCDFADRFLLRREIPCAYVTARQLSRMSVSDLNYVVCKMIFPSAVTSLEEGLSTLEEACCERRIPFVLIMDGLNEHPDVRNFAGQLEHLLKTLMRYPHVRVLMTCRSEFLEQRFGALLSGSLATFIHHSEAHGQRFDDDQYQELVKRYFSFFKVDPKRVDKRVINLLQRDVLLLRFFCETYGARGRNDEYDQPRVVGVYRDEIFRHYVEHKMGRAQSAVSDNHSVARPLVQPVRVRSVLSLIAAHMLTTGKFMDVPRSVIPSDLDHELTVLLDEELVLRHDLGPAPSLLEEPSDLLNFTFDELRDFLLAQYLLKTFTEDQLGFFRILDSQQPETSQSAEGVQRFLFYTSRNPSNKAFLESYRSHSWYDAVYDSEIFAILPQYLSLDDHLIVQSAISDGGLRAQDYVKKLALRWDSSSFPFLNLDFLLEIVRSEDHVFFSEVIVPAFSKASYGEQPLGKSFCYFIKKEVLSKFNPDLEHPYTPIFHLLLLLLPVESDKKLGSPAFDVFVSLISEQPLYATALLKQAVIENKPLHRPYLWRLLSILGSEMGDSSTLLREAEADIIHEESSECLRREAERFIFCVRRVK